tara:strand:+ start:1870 stop:2499 length:630 start_codon:yes stop_codon:yes gene_type:complete
MKKFIIKEWQDKYLKEDRDLWMVIDKRKERYLGSGIPVRDVEAWEKDGEIKSFSHMSKAEATKIAKKNPNWTSEKMQFDDDEKKSDAHPKDVAKLQNKTKDWDETIGTLRDSDWKPVKIPSAAVKYFDSLLAKYGKPAAKVFTDNHITMGPVWDDGPALDFNDPTHYISYWKGKGGDWYLMIDTAGNASSSKDYKKLGKSLENRYKKLK